MPRLNLFCIFAAAVGTVTYVAQAERELIKKFMNSFYRVDGALILDN
jgi:hypothetical protein